MCDVICNANAHFHGRIVHKHGFTIIFRSVTLYISPSLWKRMFFMPGNDCKTIVLVPKRLRFVHFPSKTIILYSFIFLSFDGPHYVLFNHNCIVFDLQPCMEQYFLFLLLLLLPFLFSDLQFNGVSFLFSNWATKRGPTLKLTIFSSLPRTSDVSSKYPNESLI